MTDENATYEGTSFESLAIGDHFKSSLTGPTIFMKVRPSNDPRRHNAMSRTRTKVSYHLFDRAKNIHPLPIRRS